MRPVVRYALLTLVAVVAVGALAWSVGLAPASTSALSRREMFVGLLTLAVLALALYGFDVRDWF